MVNPARDQLDALNGKTGRSGFGKGCGANSSRMLAIKHAVAARHRWPNNSLGENRFSAMSALGTGLPW
jgi:hypothetical protein